MKIAVLSVVAVAALAGQAMAGNVLINPTAAQFLPGQTPSATATTAASAKMRFATNSWDMSLSPTTSTTTPGAFLQRDLANANNTPAALTAAWNFTLNYVAGQGYTYSVTSVTFPNSGTLTWRSDAAQNVNGGTANTLAGEGPTRAFNFIRLHARAGNSPQAMSFSNLAFSSSLTSTGSFDSGAASSTSTRNSIDGSGGNFFYYQDIVSDTNLATVNWSLSGTIQSNATTTAGEGIRFQVDMRNSSFQLNVIPLPTGAAMGLAGLTVLGFRRRRSA